MLIINCPVSDSHKLIISGLGYKKIKKSNHNFIDAYYCIECSKLYGLYRIAGEAQISLQVTDFNFGVK